MKNLPKQVTFPDGSSCGNFDLLDAETQKTAGYYSYVDVKPSYDSRTQKLVTLPETIGDVVTANYEVVDIPLAELKEARHSEIKQLRDGKLNDSVFTYDSQEFKFSEQVANDVVQFYNLVDIVGEENAFPYNWTQANDEQYTFTNLAGFKTFGMALGVHKNTIIGTAKYHMAAVNALDDAVDIMEYDITAGW